MHFRLIHSHFHPELSAKRGTWLAAHDEVHAMVDISDGLQCDLSRLIKQSKVGAKIETSSSLFQPLFQVLV